MNKPNKIKIDINIKGITVKNEAKQKEIMDMLRKEIRAKVRECLEGVEGI